MASLEYRLFDASETYPVLCRYPDIGMREISYRFACDYWIKGGTVYEKTSAALASDGAVLYVQPVPEGRAAVFAATAGVAGEVRLEVREYREEVADYPLLHTYRFRDAVEALLHLQCDYLELAGREWLKTSTEIDEDRETYVIYVQRVD